MKKIVLQIILSILCLSTNAQNIYNIRAEKRGQDIVVLYLLETTSPCEVSLLLSQDNGTTWSAPLKNVSGDVGKNIAAGEKQITWKVLEELEQLVGDKIKFKVIANSKKSFEPEMVFVEGGAFLMGNNYADFDERPVRSVTLSAFNIGKYEVTQAQWKAVMGSNPSNFKDCDQCPVEQVSWNDVQDFIRKLNVQTGKNYRLPTEAEWEYTAKGGNFSKGYTYSGSNDLNAVGWYYDNSGSKTHTVGGKQANELGVYDLTGNVWEWCSDWHGTYGNYSETNPSGASSGQNRVLRGGGWSDFARFCRYANRISYNPGNGDIIYGFRLVLPIEDETIGEKYKEPIESVTHQGENKIDLPIIVDDAIAEYPGGEAAMYKFISDNLLYPEEAVENGIEGKVYLRFVVDVDGTAKDFTVMKSVPGGQSLEQAAIEVCKKFPKFNPPMRDGKPIKTYFVLPINFKL